MGLGVQHYKCCRSGVFARIMMVELQVQLALEVGEAVSAIPLQLWPCAPRNRDAVAPAQIWCFDVTEAAGCIDRLFVKVAVLDEVMLGQQGKQSSQRIGESRCVRNMIWADPV